MKNLLFCTFFCAALFGVKVGIYVSWKEGGFLGVLAFSAALGAFGFIISALAGLGRK